MDKCSRSKIVISKTDNHFTPSDHNAISHVQHIVEKAKETLKINTNNDNKFIHSDENMSSRRVDPVVIPKKINEKHPIVNLCQSYIESVFFQYDSAPGTSGHIEFNNIKKGRIVHFTYFLDSSAGDNVVVNIDLISPNKGRKSIIQWVAGGNTFIKGTFNNQKLDFNVNQKIETGEQIQLTFNNTSSNDVTLMAIVDIKYGEEDFE